MHHHLHQIARRLFFTILFFGFSLSAQTADFAGQISGSAYVNDLSADETMIGVRYIPDLSLQKNISDDFNIDTEFSLNMYSTHRFDFSNYENDVKPYRLWFRLATSQFQVRIGLQKINFGSAMLLRPLMWFDRIDPRDPLQITDGVYAVLLRYYFLNNTNIWLWGVYGQDRTKGLEAIPTKKNSGEYGGRVQVPFMNGEIAASYHHRNINPGAAIFPLVHSDPGSHPENRYAVDGKWDIGVGFWFEYVWLHQDIHWQNFRNRKLLNIGMDYTFALGNGVHALSEFFVYDAKATMKISALLLDYNLGLLDQIMAIVYFDWENHDFYRFATWRRTLDKWSFNLSFFWNPGQNNLYKLYSKDMTNQFSGKGIQFLVVFNY